MKKPTRKRSVAVTPARKTNQRPAKSISMAEQVERLNRNWRDNYNPLRGLNAQKAVELFQKAQRGEYMLPMWTFAAPWNGVEVANATYMALIERCISPVLEMDWDVLISAGSNGEPLPADQAQLAADQAGLIRGVLGRVTNMQEAQEHLLMARFRHYAHLQPGNSNGAPTLDGVERFSILNQWNMLRDGSDGAWYWNPDARDTSAEMVGDSFKLDVDADLLIPRVVRRFVGRVALVHTLRSVLSEKDWDGFIEIFGIPARVIIGPPSMTDQQKEAFLTASDNIKEGTGGVLPHGSSVHSDEGVRGLQPFEGRLEYLNKQLVMAGTGGMLTMLAESGSGTLAGGAHMEVFNSIARAEARRISECLQRYFVDRLLDLRFPGQPKLAYFEIAAEEEQDIGEVIEHNSKLAASGFRIAQAQLEERTHYKLEPYQAAPIAPLALNAAPDNEEGTLESANQDLVTDAVAKTLGVRQQMMKPFLAALDEKSAQGNLTDADLLDALEQLAEQLPELVPAGSIEDQAAIIEGLLGAGVANKLATAKGGA